VPLLPGQAGGQVIEEWGAGPGDPARTQDMPLPSGG
jgi:hypothetical protein